jgi:hypothetical protein
MKFVIKTDATIKNMVYGHEELLKMVYCLSYAGYLKEWITSEKYSLYYTTTARDQKVDKKEYI